VYAQAKIKGTYNRYAQVFSRRRVRGADVSEAILRSEGIDGVEVTETPGILTDHYDPRTKTIRLSQGVFNSTSISALGIAAHETGHAVQHSRAYGPLAIRNAILPLASFGSQLAFPLFFIGLFFVHSPFLMDLGILLYTGAVGFSVLTLPVEFNASQRALQFLREGAFLDNEELDGTRKVLNAAALTYVAATCMSVAQLLRMLLLRERD
jgi:hypothetical protein